MEDNEDGIGLMLGYLGIIVLTLLFMHSFSSPIESPTQHAHQGEPIGCYETNTIMVSDGQGGYHTQGICPVIEQHG